MEGQALDPVEGTRSERGYKEIVEELTRMGIPNYGREKHGTIILLHAPRNVSLVFHHDVYTDTIWDCRGESMNREDFLEMVSLMRSLRIE